MLSRHERIAREILALVDAGLSWAEAVLNTSLGHLDVDDEVMTQAERRASHLLETGS